MCPTDPSNQPTPFSFKLVDRLHGISESAEQAQTLAEQLAGDIYGQRVGVEQARFAAKRLEGVARVLAASAAKLVEEMPVAEYDRPQSLRRPPWGLLGRAILPSALRDRLSLSLKSGWSRRRTVDG